MPKHSPAPWRTECEEIFAADDLHVCHVTGGSGVQFIDQEDNEVCLANKALLRASPELAEALQECFSDPNCFAFASEDFYKAKQRLLAINNIVTAVIAKATVTAANQPAG